MPVTVNVDNLFRTLPRYFDGPVAAVRELLQNAARTGCRHLHVMVTHSHRCRDAIDVTVIDDGPGIVDVEAMLSVSQSDWSDDTKRTEDPAGMGVFAALANCTRVRWESRFGSLTVDGKKFFAQEKYRAGLAAEIVPVDEDDSYAEGGTRVTMEGIRPDSTQFNLGRTLCHVIEEFARYFNGMKITLSTDVIWHNGVDRAPSTPVTDNLHPFKRDLLSLAEQLNPKDLDAGKWHDTAFAKIPGGLLVWRDTARPGAFSHALPNYLVGISSSYSNSRTISGFAVGWQGHDLSRSEESFKPRYDLIRYLKDHCHWLTPLQIKLLDEHETNQFDINGPSMLVLLDDPALVTPKLPDRDRYLVDEKVAELHRTCTMFIWQTVFGSQDKFHEHTKIYAIYDDTSWSKDTWQLYNSELQRLTGMCMDNYLAQVLAMRFRETYTLAYESHERNAPPVRYNLIEEGREQVMFLVMRNETTGAMTTIAAPSDTYAAVPPMYLGEASLDWSRVATPWLMQQLRLTPVVKVITYRPGDRAEVGKLLHVQTKVLHDLAGKTMLAEVLDVLAEDETPDVGSDNKPIPQTRLTKLIDHLETTACDNLEPTGEVFWVAGRIDHDTGVLTLQDADDYDTSELLMLMNEVDQLDSALLSFKDVCETHLQDRDELDDALEQLNANFRDFSNRIAGSKEINGGLSELAGAIDAQFTDLCGAPFTVNIKEGTMTYGSPAKTIKVRL